MSPADEAPPHQLVSVVPTVKRLLLFPLSAFSLPPRHNFAASFSCPKVTAWYPAVACLTDPRKRMVTAMPGFMPWTIITSTFPALFVVLAVALTKIHRVLPCSTGRHSSTHVIKCLVLSRLTGCTNLAKACGNSGCAPHTLQF